MLKKVPCVTLIFSVFLLLLLFSNVNLASAEDTAGSKDCASNRMTETLGILRLRSHPFASLRMTDEVGFSPSLRMTEGGIPSPSSKCSDSGQNESSVESDAQLSAKRVGQRAMYRLYNKWTGEHFYTCSEEERDEIAKVGWTKEDIGWVSPKESSVPVYRLYNKYIPGGDHHYTPNADERDNLVKVGWIYEGIGWYSADEGSLFRAPVYRQYNPYADTGTHNYTLSTSEKNTLVKAGWHDEGVGYYGLDQSQMSAIDFNKDINVTTTSKVYNGKAQTQTITSTNLKENEDFVVEYSNNKNVGTATITITGTNGFFGEKVYTFQITQKTISQVRWGDLEFGYDGKAHVPTATAVGLCSGDSATITVTASGNHTDTGTYTATATAISNKNYKLASNFKTDFRIGTKIDFDNKNKPTVDTADEVYTGSVITKEVSVAGLTKDKDYTVTYKDNVNVGTATLTIKGIGEYFGEKSYTFKITQKSLTGATITPETLTYNGSEQTAKISKVTLDGRNLKEGTDFRVVAGNKGTDASTYEGLTIEGIGNYKDTATGKWEISPKTVGIEWSNTSIIYDGDSKAPSAQLTGVCAGDSVTATVTVTEEEHTNVGTYNATATKLDNANYQLPTPNPTTTFEIVAKEATEEDVKDIELTLPETGYVYDKTPKEPAVDGIPDKFVEDTDYSIEYSNNVNAGENTAKVTVKFKGNYTGEKVLTFSIDQRPVKLTGISAKEKVYDGNKTAEILTTDDNIEGFIDTDDVSFVSVAGEFDTKNQGENKTVTVSLSLTGTDKYNYKLSDEQLTLISKINPKTVTISGLTAKERAYVEGDTSVTLEGTAKFADGDICDGDIVTITSCSASDYSTADAEDGKETSLTFTLNGNDDGNYVITEESKKITGNVLAIVKFDTNCSTTIADKNVHKNSKMEDDVTAQLPTRKGLTKEGWYNNAACATDAANSKFWWDFSSKAFTDNITTLYANWTPTADDADGNLSYWIAPSYKVTTGNSDETAGQPNNAADKNFTRDSYVSEEWNVLKSSTEIQEDVNVLKKGDVETNPTYKTVKEQYDGILTSDKYHLYTKWNGTTATGESASAVSTGKNSYAEFRVIQVGEHDNDGSAVTFMATHALPTAKVMNSEGKGTGGWADSPIRTSTFASGGYVQTGLSGLKNAAKAVNKRTAYRATSIEEWKTDVEKSITSDTFWLASQTEIFGNNIDNGNTLVPSVFKAGEGKQYAWMTSREVNAKSGKETLNPAIVPVTKTRADEKPAEARWSFVWLRSPIADSESNGFATVYEDGSPKAYVSSWVWGVVPAFAM